MKLDLKMSGPSKDDAFSTKSQGKKNLYEQDVIYILDQRAVCVSVVEI